MVFFFLGEIWKGFYATKNGGFLAAYVSSEVSGL